MRGRGAIAGLIALGLAAGLLPAAACAETRAAAATLESGTLRAEVDAQPFRISFTDTASGRVLRTLGGAPSSPFEAAGRYGSLGYTFDLRLPVLNNAYLGYYVGLNVDTLFFHGTRVISSAADAAGVTLEVATNDPLGHRIRVRLERAGDGGIAVESKIAPGSGPLAGLATASNAAFETGAGERFLGFGERSNAVDQTGNQVFNWAEEGPFSSGAAEDLLRPLLPDFTFPTGPTATNFPIPWAVSTRGFGVLIDQPQRSYFRLGSDRADAWEAEVEAAAIKLLVFGGPTPADVVRRYSDSRGRQPDPAPWFFGPWFQPTREARPYELADRFRAEDVPVTVAQTYTHYLPCGAQAGRGASERERSAGYHERGFKITTYFNPHVCASYSGVFNPAAAAGHLVKNALGLPYLVTNPFTADGLVSEIDFTHPGARERFAGLLDEAIGNGYDGWMEDFGEYTPTDSVFHDGRTGREMHNRYPVAYHCTSYDHTRKVLGREAAVFIRSGWDGVQPCARAVWGGDPTEDWSCADGLCAAVHQALSMGLSGIAYWGTDIGGFHALVNARTDDELNSRWLEFGAFNGIMRTQANGLGNPVIPGSRSEVWDPAVMPIWRRYTKLRTQLHPYIQAASEAYQRDGLPISRHLSLAFPDDPTAVRQQDEFMFGPDLLAAPVIEEGARTRSLYLPGGRWIDLWRTLSYDPGNGDFAIGGRPRMLEGGRQVELPAPLEEMPLLARAGTILPLLPSDVDTLAGNGSDPGLVNVGERDGIVELLAFPRGESRAELPRGEVVTSAEVPPRKIKPKKLKRKRKAKRRRAKVVPGGWELRIAGSPGHDYRVEASLADLQRPFTPCGVMLGKKWLKPGAWSYDPGAATLRTSFKRAGSARLLVTDRCAPRKKRKRPRK
jgi:alpha-glucosidase (family GH31 glycosyl hydrolase)